MHLRNISIATLLLLFYNNVNSQVYQGIHAGKVLHDWYLAGPVRVSADTTEKPGDAAQKQFFNRKDDQHIPAAFVIPAAGKPDLKNWRKYSSKKDNIDLDSVFNHPDFAS